MQQKLNTKAILFIIYVTHIYKDIILSYSFNERKTIYCEVCDSRYRRTDNVYQQHAGMNSPHNENTSVHESSQQNNNISDSNHEQSYVRDSPQYGNNNNYATINQEYQHPQQQQATQNIHQESSSHYFRSKSTN